MFSALEEMLSKWRGDLKSKLESALASAFSVFLALAAKIFLVLRCSKKYCISEPIERMNTVACFCIIFLASSENVF